MSFVASQLNHLYYQWKRNNWIVYPHRFFSDYDDVSIERPIFLVGNQGDGLTLVSRMLRRHPQIISITGNHKYWSGADEMQGVMRCRLPRTLRQGGRFVCKDFPHKRLTPPRSWSYASNDLIGYYRKTAADYDPQTAASFRRIIREALYRYSGGADKRFTDKSQLFTVKMGYVDALLKDTNPYFVLVTRNPYATCYRAALGKAGDMRRYAKYMSLDERVEVCVQHWSNSMCCVLEDKDKVSNFKFVRFEDVLHEPRKTLAELCDFLDLSFTDDMIPSEHHSVPFGSKYKDRWYPLRVDVNRQYLDAIPSKYIDLIVEHCRDIAEQFGYLPPNTK